MGAYGKLRDGLRTVGGALGIGVQPIADALVARLAWEERARRDATASCVPSTGDRERPILVGGDDLARALHERSLRVVSLVSSRGRRKAAPWPCVVAVGDALPFADGALGGACLAGLPEGEFERWRAVLAECARVVAPGRVVAVSTTASALVRKVAPPETLAALMLHAGLAGVEQRLASAFLFTSATVAVA